VVDFCLSLRVSILRKWPLNSATFTVCISPVWSTQYIQYKDSKRWVPVTRLHRLVCALCRASLFVLSARANQRHDSWCRHAIFSNDLFVPLVLFPICVYIPTRAWFRVVKWVVGDYGIVADSFIGWSLHVSASHLSTLPAWVTSRSFYSEKRLITIVTYSYISRMLWARNVLFKVFKTSKEDIGTFQNTFVTIQQNNIKAVNKFTF